MASEETIRPKDLEGKETPKLDDLEKREPGVTIRYFAEFKAYKGKQDLILYVEARAARKLGRKSEGPAIAAYSSEAGVSAAKNTKTIEILEGNPPAFTTSRERIPDVFEQGHVVADVKNVQEQSLDEQMRDNVRIANGQKVRLRGQTQLLDGGLRFDLIVRAPTDAHPEGTYVSGPLLVAVTGTGGEVYEVITW